MGHDPSKVLLGATQSSAKDVSTVNHDPADFPAGTAVRQKSDGALSVTKADGGWLGISLGRSLSSTKKTAVARAGELVPIRLTDDNVFASLTKAELTFTSKIRGVAGNDISIEFVDDGAGAVEVIVDDQKITVEMDDTAETGSTAAAIKAAIEANAAAHALIGVEISQGDDDVVQDDFVEDNLEGGVDAYSYVEEGQKVWIDDVTGLANVEDDGGVTTTASNAIYSSAGALTGIAEDGTEVAVALVDMPGGL